MTAESRNKVFKLKSKDVVGAENEHAEMVWGIMMEATYDDGTLSALALINGTTSLLNSKGNDIIGAEKHDDVAGLAAAIVNGGDLFFTGYGEATKETPMPDANNVHFYFLTDNAIIKTDQAEEELLEEHDHPLAPLYHTMQLLMSVAQEKMDEAA
jgi:hypothetical protein